MVTHDERRYFRCSARLTPLVLATVTLAAACCKIPEKPPSLVDQIDTAMRRGATFLLRQQSFDGAWRSEVYGAFKRGDALTPLALRALIAIPAQSTPGTAQVEHAIQRGSDALAAWAPGEEDAPGPPLFAVYTAAQAIEVLSHSSDPEDLAAREAWTAELAGRQLTEALGWSAEEAFFGGWGYSAAVPRKPPPGALQPPLLEANISATVFALQGLRAGGMPADGRACRQALLFLEGLQNFVEGGGPWEPLEDGGFHFIAEDPVRNKAGVAGTDVAGRIRFRSYGSATADGLRGLLLCGLPASHPRVQAAVAWLTANWSASEHPGAFAPRLAADRDGLYYYWAASAAQALALAGSDRVLFWHFQPKPWADSLATELIRRQGTEGSWINPVVTMREDEPNIATSMALLALAEVRRVIDSPEP